MTFKNESLEHLDLEYALDEEGVDFKVGWGRSGKQINVKTCPFCGNNKYKVYINATTGLGNCFAGSCTQGTFNKWSFLKELWGLGTRDAQAKIDVMAINQGWRPKVEFTKYDPGECLMPANQRVADLPAMPRYLQERGIKQSTAAAFDLRLVESGWFEVKDPTGRTIKQDYSNRIVTPIYTLDGTLISFQGRDITGEAEKRYLFPPMFSSTGSALYNINNWRTGVHNEVVITEGLFDAMAVHQALDEWEIGSVLATASFGMAFTVSTVGADDQMNRLLELKRLGLKQVTFLWDNEPAAREAALDACVKVMRYGFQVRLALLEGAKDPGEATPKQIIDALANATVITSELQAMLLKRKLSQ